MSSSGSEITEIMTGVYKVAFEDTTTTRGGRYIIKLLGKKIKWRRREGERKREGKRKEREGGGRRRGKARQRRKERKGKREGKWKIRVC